MQWNTWEIWAGRVRDGSSPTELNQRMLLSPPCLWYFGRTNIGRSNKVEENTKVPLGTSAGLRNFLVPLPLPIRFRSRSILQLPPSISPPESQLPTSHVSHWRSTRANNMQAGLFRSEFSPLDPLDPLPNCDEKAKKTVGKSRKIPYVLYKKV
jgi:hypothetical protein